MPAKIRVTMKSTRRGAEDGIHVREYEEGKTYELTDSLAKPFLDEKWAVPAAAEKAAPTPKPGAGKGEKPAEKTDKPEKTE